MKTRGNGAAGGGLKARIAEYEKMTQTGYVANGNGVQNVKVHRPGSQNPRKGGKGKK